MSHSIPKVGVFICHCGTNIAGKVDVNAVAEYAATLPCVAAAHEYKFMCSDPGQQLLINEVREKGLNRVVVASCSPRMHEKTFRKATQTAGVNPYFFQMACIREHDSWVTEDPVKATEKAKELVRGAVSRVLQHKMLLSGVANVNPNVLVIGGGIAGMQAALDIADAGKKVYLVEREPSLGGNMLKFDKTFPTLDCAACIGTPKLVSVGQHANIELMSYSEVLKVEGFVGNFTVRVRHKARYVSVSKCTGCGDCVEACPITIPNAYESGLTSRHAIGRSFAQAVPGAFAIVRAGMPPCQAACPAGVNAVGYMTLTGLGKFDEALAVVRERMPFAAVCGRICFHPCESVCKRGQLDKPVAICHTKRFLGDHELERGVFTHPPLKASREEKVGVVGAGPAGLSAAYYLALEGYPVTLFEKLPVAGGMLAVGIPDYRLPRDILEAEIRNLLDMGVTLKTGMIFGRDVTFDSLQKEGYNAFFIATGLHQSLSMGIEGEDLEGVMGGVDLLRKVSLNKDVPLGERVVIIGGGNVAVDAARTCLRLGAGEVTLLYRRSRAEMPAYDVEVEEAEQEGVKFVFLAAPVRLMGENGKLNALAYLKMALGEPDESGRRRPAPIEGSETIIGVDNVIPAIGQMPDKAFLAGLGLEADPKGRIVAHEETLATSEPGVFAGGDCTLGPASFVEAVAHGRKAAESIRSFLEHGGLREIKPKEKPVDPGLTEEERKRARPVAPRKMPTLAVPKRKGNFAEVELGFTAEMAMAEGQRCLSCSICCQCGECTRKCGPQAIDLNDHERIRELDVGSIIVATGFKVFDPTPLTHYGFGRYPEVYTSLQFERLNNATGPTEGKIRTKDGRAPKRVAIIHCVGSRDQNYNKYCSRVCCMYSMKLAHLVKEKVEAEVYEFYIDIRSPGKGYEEFYNRLQGEGTHFIRGKVAEVTDIVDNPADRGRLTVVAEDTLARKIRRIPVDMVVLSVGLEPADGVEDVARMVGISQDADGWINELHPKLGPLATPSDGIFIAGCCQGPKDIPDSVAQAQGAAALSLSLISRGKIEIEPTVAIVNERLCTGCKTCVELCAYSAVSFSEETKSAFVNDVLCKGCGTCAAACPVAAIAVQHFTPDQIFAEIEGIFA
jgi:heterodisulfide reductase subunit A2